MKISDKELDDLLISTRTVTENTSEKEVQSWRETYRKVEAENIRQIKKAGSVEKWYLSGQGRVFNVSKE